MRPEVSLYLVLVGLENPNNQLKIKRLKAGTHVYNIMNYYETLLKKDAKMEYKVEMITSSIWRYITKKEIIDLGERITFQINLN